MLWVSSSFFVRVTALWQEVIWLKYCKRHFCVNDLLYDERLAEFKRYAYTATLKWPSLFESTQTILNMKSMPTYAKVMENTLMCTKIDKEDLISDVARSYLLVILF